MPNPMPPANSPKPPARPSVAWLIPLFAAAALAGFAAWRRFDKPSPSPKPLPPPPESAAAPQDPAPQPVAPTAAPSVASRPSIPPPPSAPEKPAFRLSALFDPPRGSPAVGIVHRASGDSYKIFVGDKSFDGWQLVSIDFDGESALFQKNGASATVRMEQGLPPSLAS